MRNCPGRWVRFTAFLAIPAMLVPGPAWAGRIKHPRAVFSGLDKITGRTIAFEAAAGETVQFGSLQITEHACYTRPATEAPQTATFVEVDEVSAGNQYKRIFSGWMFAASPGLHGIEHPIYDIWLTDCEGEGAVEAGLDARERPAPAQTPPAASESPPDPETKASRRAHQRRPGETPSPERGEQTVAAPPPLGQPIEVGPPPGFIPVPQTDRRPPVQRYYPSGPDAAPEPYAGESNQEP
ncbi:MAG: DUF2155 domain-containing protein [Beijerinckiaceae bacterium]|nr:DUF2155 domain-containing protein [Beijerinckiaceae bacterium]MCI0735074.1 DUF2155 domain-containing protein [Beijerinckiaceae bacterium]